jgi:hypothetical protein
MSLTISKLKFIEVECHIEMKLILMERATEKNILQDEREVRELQRCPLGAQPCEMATNLRKHFVCSRFTPQNLCP